MLSFAETHLYYDFYKDYRADRVIPMSSSYQQMIHILPEK